MARRAGAEGPFRHAPHGDLSPEPARAAAQERDGQVLRARPGTEDADRGVESATLPGRAFGAILQDYALGLEFVANAVGLLEVPCLACRLARGNRRLDLRLGRPGRTGRRPAEPGF